MRQQLSSLLVLSLIVGGVLGSTGASASIASTQDDLEPLIAFERNATIYVMETDGSDQRALTTGSEFEWSPDGSRIAFHRESAGGLFEDIWVIRRDGSDLRRVVRNRSLGELTWSADAKQLAFTGAYTNERSAIFIVNADGTGLARITSPSRWADDMLPDWSPDGTQIAFERDKYDVSDQGGNDRFLIITTRPDGSGQRVLSQERFVEAPVWSGDGLRLASELSEGISSQHDIYLMNRDGTGSQNLTRTRSPSEYEARWSPDGRTIVFESRSGRNFNIHTISIDGKRHLNLARSPELDNEPEWSPDGRSVVFVSNRDGNRDIYVMTATGRNQTNLTNSPIGTRNAAPAWSPLR